MKIPKPKNQKVKIPKLKSENLKILKVKSGKSNFDLGIREVIVKEDVKPYDMITLDGRVWRGKQ